MSRLCHLASCTHTKSNLYLANSLVATVSEPALYRLPTIQVPDLVPLIRSLGRTRVSVQVQVFLCKWFVTGYVFMARSCQHLTQPPNWSTTPCRPSATAYSIYSRLRSILEAVPPHATWGRAMPWWQGPTYHSNILFICYLSFICCDYWWIGKDMEGSVCGLIWGTFLAFVWKDWKLQNLIGMCDVFFWIQTRFRLELQCYTKPLMCWNLIQHNSFMGIILNIIFLRIFSLHLLFWTRWGMIFHIMYVSLLITGWVWIQHGQRRVIVTCSSCFVIIFSIRFLKMGDHGLTCHMLCNALINWTQVLQRK